VRRLRQSESSDSGEQVAFVEKPGFDARNALRGRNERPTRDSVTAGDKAIRSSAGSSPGRAQWGSVGPGIKDNSSSLRQGRGTVKEFVVEDGDRGRAAGQVSRETRARTPGARRCFIET